MPASRRVSAPCFCRHCQKLTPAYKKVAASLQVGGNCLALQVPRGRDLRPFLRLQGIVLVAAVDCDQADNKKLCSQQGEHLRCLLCCFSRHLAPLALCAGVQGFPTVKVATRHASACLACGSWLGT